MSITINEGHPLEGTLVKLNNCFSLTPYTPLPKLRERRKEAFKGRVFNLF
jgi:hypothetical protein